MKRMTIALLSLLIGVNAWLAFRQQRMERKLEALRSENLRLADELARRPELSPEEFRAVSKRLENARELMNAVESRLTNSSALLSQLQSASQHFTGPSPQRSAPAIASTSRHSIEYEQPVSTLPPIEGPPRPPVSSHGPNGQLLQRSWGPEQVLGSPNTHEAGDIPTAWAQQASQGTGEEWLHVNYDRAVDLSEIRVRETYNPGAISKLAAIMPDGQEVVIWEGVTPPAQAPIDTSFSAPAGLQAKSVKIYLDRTRVPGWNEIDAVELVARDGTRQWASSATASTSFAEPQRR
jgi:hypothetical protein